MFNIYAELHWRDVIACELRRDDIACEVHDGEIYIQRSFVEQLGLTKARVGEGFSNKIAVVFSAAGNLSYSYSTVKNNP